MAAIWLAQIAAFMSSGLRWGCGIHKLILIWPICGQENVSKIFFCMTELRIAYNESANHQIIEVSK